MANNRLYIVDTETGQQLMVAKSFGEGWNWRLDADQINNWLEETQRDCAASFGNPSSAKTQLKLVTENERWITRGKK